MSGRHFRERDHPRNPKNGRFVEKGGGTTAWAERISDSIGHSHGGGSTPDAHGSAHPKPGSREWLEQDPRDRRSPDADVRGGVRALRSAMLFEADPGFDKMSDDELDMLEEYMAKDPRADNLAKKSKAAVKAEKKRRARDAGPKGSGPDPGFGGSGYDGDVDEFPDDANDALSDRHPEGSPIQVEGLEGTVAARYSVGGIDMVRVDFGDNEFRDYTVDDVETGGVGLAETTPSRAPNLNQEQGNRYRAALRAEEIRLGRFLRHAERIALQTKIYEGR